VCCVCVCVCVCAIFVLYYSWQYIVCIYFGGQVVSGLFSSLVQCAVYNFKESKMKGAVV